MAKILIIEDDTELRQMYYTVFSMDDYEVTVAGNGKEGISKAKIGKPTLILLDMVMPVMNGLETLDLLKSDPDTKDIPVVILTNLGSKLDEEEALLRGAVKYLIKNEHTPRKIEKIVNEVMSGYTRGEVPKTAEEN